MRDQKSSQKANLWTFTDPNHTSHIEKMSVVVVVVEDLITPKLRHTKSRVLFLSACVSVQT